MKRQLSYSVAAVLIIALLVHNACFILYCRCKREYVGKDLASGLKIYRIKNKGTPFLLLNKIYVESDSADINEYIICHEVCHYKHGDYLWVLIRYLVLFLNWYNPVIWAAFVLSGRDCELACDEEVLKIYGADSSKDYARTLLGMFQEQTNPYGQSYEVDHAIIDEYIEYICSANTCYMCDDYALLIMNEELQPYYQHQKELDMVIPVIESRVNNLANEQH